jgi:hypothetical protein
MEIILIPFDVKYMNKRVQLKSYSLHSFMFTYIRFEPNMSANLTRYPTAIYVTKGTQP